MPNDAADGTQPGESIELPLTSLGLIGALARALAERLESVIQPKKDAPKAPLIKGFVDDGRSHLVVTVNGEEVGRYKVALTRDRFEVADQEKFSAYAESKGEIDVVITPKPTFVAAVLKHAVRNPETGTIFDSRTGEEIPGLRFVPGGTPTGTVTWIWKTFKGQPIGKDLLLAAYRRGEFNELLRDTPELLPGAQPGAEDA